MPSPSASAQLGSSIEERLWDGATTLAALAQKWNGHGREKGEIKTTQPKRAIEERLARSLGVSTSANPGGFEIPAAYARRFPHLLGMEPSTREGKRKTASQGY